MSTPRGRLEELDNHGIGTYGALSAFPELTRQLTVLFESYYSPALVILSRAAHPSNGFSTTNDAASASYSSRSRWAGLWYGSKRTISCLVGLGNVESAPYVPRP